MNLPYSRRDYDSIFNWLKTKASELSEERWTDFSEGDIGTVMLHLMSYLADMNNYSIDVTTNELFLDTAVERSSIMSILSLIGYKPRHYESAYVYVDIQDETNENMVLLPEYTAFTNEEGNIVYTTLEAQAINGKSGQVLCYEGVRKQMNYSISSIDSQGRIFLPDYNVGTNTVSLIISTVSMVEKIKCVEDVRYNSGDMCFSVHVTQDGAVYIQLPAYWKDVIDNSSSITVNYLICSGVEGRIGSNVLSKVYGTSTKYSSSKIMVGNPLPSEGGYDPETVDELKVNAPIAARTMYSIVTINDFNEVSNMMEEIAQVKAFDYNDPISGYTQPEDYYKVLLYAVPENPDISSLYLDDGSTFNTVGKVFRDFVDDRRVASLYVQYADPDYIIPEIDLDIYMDENDLRAPVVAEMAMSVIKDNFSRTKLKIGESVYGSVIGNVVHTYLPYIKYCEVHSPEFNIVAGPTQYIDMANAKFTIRVNDKQMYPVVEEVKTRTICTLPFGYMMVYNPGSGSDTVLEYIPEGEYHEGIYNRDIKVSYNGTDMVLDIIEDWIVVKPYPPKYTEYRLNPGDQEMLANDEEINYIKSEDYEEGMLPPGIIVSYEDDVMVLKVPPYYVEV